MSVAAVLCVYFLALVAGSMLDRRDEARRWECDAACAERRESVGVDAASSSSGAKEKHCSEPLRGCIGKVVTAVTTTIFNAVPVHTPEQVAAAGRDAVRLELHFRVPSGGVCAEHGPTASVNTANGGVDVGFSVGDPARYRDAGEPWRRGMVMEVHRGRPRLPIVEADAGGSGGAPCADASPAVTKELPVLEQRCGSRGGLVAKVAAGPDAFSSDGAGSDGAGREREGWEEEWEGWEEEWEEEDEVTLQFRPMPSPQHGAPKGGPRTPRDVRRDHPAQPEGTPAGNSVAVVCMKRVASGGWLPWGLTFDCATMQLLRCTEGSVSARCEAARRCVGMPLQHDGAVPRRGEEQSSKSTELIPQSEWSAR
eukprot:gene22741-24157_t